MEINKNFKAKINDENLRTKKGKNVNEFRKNGKFTDITLRTRDGTEIQVHQNIMACKSSYFDSLFENPKYICSGIIDILCNISGYHLELIIDYIYTEEILIKFEDALAINQYANYFFIKPLEEETTKFLCDNINPITCLKYWRHSSKMSNRNLEQKCLQYILENNELFFNNSVKELKYKEMKLIISKSKLSEEILFKNIIIWIKNDFIDHQSYINELLQNIKLSEISTKFIEENILCDQDLMNSNYFQNIALKYCKNSQIHIIKLETTNDISNEHYYTKNIPNVNRINTNFQSTTESIHKTENYNLPNIERNKNLITFSTTWTTELNLDSKIIKKLFKHGQRLKYSVNSFKSNLIFISGGGWFSGTKKCQSYCHKRKTIKLLPSMKSNRKFHRTIEMNGKIFACGGLFNRGSIEYFNIDSEIWNVCNSNLLEKEKDFGIITYENSLYTFGGSTSLMNSKSVERFDLRENKWFKINMNSKYLLFTRSIRLNDSVYCFGTNFAQIYDIRMNSWRNEINYPENEPWYNFDVTEIDNKILIGKSTFLAQTYNLFEYDIHRNNFMDTKVNMQLFKGYMDFHIVKIDY